MTLDQQIKFTELFIDVWQKTSSLPDSDEQSEAIDALVVMYDFFIDMEQLTHMSADELLIKLINKSHRQENDNV